MLTAAISAIDIALHDVVGKALGVPVYQLLGGKQRDLVPCFVTTSGTTIEQLVENCKLLLDNGCNVIRTGPARREGKLSVKDEAEKRLFEPRETLGVTAAWLTELRQELGPDPVLGIDYHHRLTVAEAASFCQKMPPGTLDFLEEPIRDESPEAYESLRTMTDVPFAIGEEFASKWQFLPYLERGIAQFARIDVCNVGGLTESMKVASLAESHYIDLMPHNPLGPICRAASLHLAAAVPNFAWLEHKVSPAGQGRKRNEDFFPVQCEQEGSMLKVPDTPGLGVEFNEELAKEQTFKFWEPWHLRRQDGSYTNW